MYYDSIRERGGGTCISLKSLPTPRKKYNDRVYHFHLGTDQFPWTAKYSQISCSKKNLCNQVDARTLTSISGLNYTADALNKSYAQEVKWVGKGCLIF